MTTWWNVWVALTLPPAPSWPGWFLVGDDTMKTRTCTSFSISKIASSRGFWICPHCSCTSGKQQPAWWRSFLWRAPGRSSHTSGPGHTHTLELYKQICYMFQFVKVDIIWSWLIDHGLCHKMLNLDFSTTNLPLFTLRQLKHVEQGDAVVELPELGKRSTVATSRTQRP